MSYDIRLIDPTTGETARTRERHALKGGTYCVGTISDFPEGRYVFAGTHEAWLNVTYNYATDFYKVLPNGIRSIYGLTGAEAVPVLEKAIADLGGVNRDENYWAATPGNAAAALSDLLELAKMLPEAVFEGD